MNSSKRDISNNLNLSQKIEHFCKKTATFLVFIFLCFILLLNMIISTHPGGRRGEADIYLSAKIAIPFLLLPFFVLLIKKVASHINYKLLVVFFIIYSLLFTTIFFLILKPTFVADAGEIYDLSLDINYNPGYIQEYPNNLGYLSFLKIITRIPIKTEIAMTIINTFCFMLACYSLLKMCDIFSFSLNTKKTLLLLFMLFLPFCFEILFFYNDMLGLGFSIFALLNVLKWRETGKNRYLLLLVLSIILMFTFRQNTLIPLLAIIIYIIFTITRKTLVVSLVSVALCIAPVFLVPLSLKTFYSSRYNLTFDNSHTAPAIAFIAMSSMDSVETRFGTVGAAVAIPGWWNAYNLYCTVELKEKCSDDAKDLLYSQLSAYLHNPRRGFLFIMKKISSQWTDPTFLLPYAFNNNHIPEQGAVTKGRFFYLYCEIVHLAILVFSLIGFRNLKKKHSVQWDKLLPLIAVFGYFLFSIIWEAKSRYIMLVFPLLLPFAAYGITVFKPKELLSAFKR